MSGAVNNAVIHVENLVCQAGGRTVLALPQLHVGAGERVAIVGPNGAGKSTLLRTLSGFANAPSGRVTVLGRELAPRCARHELRALRAEIGQVMQGLHLVQRLTARENVLIGALGRLAGWRSWARVHHAPDVAEAEHALDAAGLRDKAAVRADRLSGGERQKVAIARMLMQRPRLILADEPTASLDPSAAIEVCRLLVRAAAGATLISVVHNPGLLPLIADRVIGLRQGRLVFDRPLAEVDAAALDDLYKTDVAEVVHRLLSSAARGPHPNPLPEGEGARLCD